MDKITENIYLGSSSDAQFRKTQLKAEGITAILNCARDLTNQTTTHKEFQLYHIGLMDGGGNYELLLPAAVLTLHTLLENGHKVLVHCHEGKSRSALVVAFYLYQLNKFSSLHDAETFLRSKRPRVRINPSMLVEIDVDKITDMLFNAGIGGLD